MAPRMQSAARRSRSKLHVNPNNPMEVMYDPTGTLPPPRLKKQPREGVTKETKRWFSHFLKTGSLTGPDRYTWWPDKFATVDQCPSLNDLGHTRPKLHLAGYEKGWYTDHELDAGFMVAPQFYKNEADYAKFPMKPHEQQVLYAGNGFMPVPMDKRRFRAGEDNSAEWLRHSVFVRRFHVDPSELRDQMEARYWAKKNIDQVKDEWWKNAMKRMASSFGGGNVMKIEGEWMPKGDIFAPENKMTVEEALDMWDEHINPKFSGSRKGSANKQAAQGPKLYETAEMKQLFSNNDGPGLGMGIPKMPKI